MPERIHTRFLVVGSGIAGLHTAWRASQHGDVLLLTKRSLFDSATAYAQGGIAAALGAGDSPTLHRRDTLAAGAALCDAAAVEVLVEEGPARVRELQTAGAEFDLDPNGQLKLGREAAHSTNRIVHAHGDKTGAEGARTLIARVRASTRASPARRSGSSPTRPCSRRAAAARSIATRRIRWSPRGTATPSHIAPASPSPTWSSCSSIPPRSTHRRIRSRSSRRRCAARGRSSSTRRASASW